MAIELITCGGCATRWTARGAAHCSSCHQTFGTTNLFDTHRTGYGERGSCLDPETIRNGRGDRLLFLRDDAWRGPEMTEEQKLARYGTRSAA